MKINSNIVTSAARAAATVVILRDSNQGPEVFLIKRHGLSDVLGGAYVFPGGKVDRFDSELDAAKHLDQSHQVLHASLNEPDIESHTAAGVYVAALREAFEESGVLYADGADDALAKVANALLREGHSFDEMLGLLGLRLQTRHLLPWVRWVTPLMPSVMNKRFDTRFFIAAMPEGQNASHNDHESTESVWLKPRTALEQYRDGAIELAPPQIMSLAHLSRYASVAVALQDALSRKPPVVQPEPYDDNGVRVLTYPGDAHHSVRERALPGPTRLRHNDKRFIPEAGFEALFA